MSESANVRAINSLDELRSALVTFRAEAQESLQAAAQEVARTLEWLAERRQHWQNEVRRREESLSAAKAALARCEASGYRDDDGHYHQPDCSSQQMALVQARVRLREAEAELETVKGWTGLVQRAADDYQQKARQLDYFLTNDMSKATALLASSAETLQTYAVMGVGLIGLAGLAVSFSTATDSQSNIEEPPETPVNEGKVEDVATDVPEPTPPKEPLGPATPAERREGTVGGSERRG